MLLRLTTVTTGNRHALVNSGAETTLFSNSIHAFDLVRFGFPLKLVSKEQLVHQNPSYVKPLGDKTKFTCMHFCSLANQREIGRPRMTRTNVCVESVCVFFFSRRRGPSDSLWPMGPWGPIWPMKAHEAPPCPMMAPSLGPPMAPWGPKLKLGPQS
jgi:hypothetical protein